MAPMLSLMEHTHVFDYSNALGDNQADSLGIIEQISYLEKKFEPGSFGATIE